MRNPLTLLRSAFSLPLFRKKSRSSYGLLGSLTLSLVIYLGAPGSDRLWAASPATAPPQLKETLTRIDTAANNRNLQSVLQFYAQNFTHSDGLTRQTLQQAISGFWKRYPNLQYRTELVSWQAEGKGFVAETVTYITGMETVGERPITLSATLRSRQRFENQRIVRQEVLSERIQMTAGEKPPTVKVNLPDQVRVGQQYTLDAIVQEPLGEDLLLGAAIEEPVRAGGYLKPTTIELEPLSAGGIFKTGRAPAKPDSRWISTILVRGDGMTLITQRLRVVANSSRGSGSR